MSAPKSKEFMLLFRGPEWDKGLSPEELQQMLGRVTAWFDRLKQQGKVKASQVLAKEGRTISEGKGRIISDGPYAESKETIGGYLLLQLDDLEEAIAIAKSCPTLSCGISIEIRPALGLEECEPTRRAKEQLARAVSMA